MELDMELIFFTSLGLYRQIYLIGALVSRLVPCMLCTGTANKKEPDFAGDTILHFPLEL
jgi:hypothetical protein